MKTTTQLRRIGTSAAAAAAVLALAAPSAGAVAGAPAIFAGASEALALELRVTAPSALMGSLAGILPASGISGNTLIQKVSITNAALNSSGLAKTVATLLDGVIPSAAGGSATGQASGSQAIAAADYGIIQVGVGTTSWASDAVNNISTSASELAHLNVSLTPLFTGETAVPASVTDALQGAVQQVTGVVNAVVDELNGVLTVVEDTVAEATGAVGLDIPQVLPAQLPAVPDITKVSLVEIKKIWANSNVSTDAGLVRSVSKSGIVEASILGGLISVPTFEYSTFAETAGLPGTAKAGGKILDIKVKVGDTIVGVTNNILTVGDFTLDINDPTLAGLGLPEQLDAVVDLLSEVLNTVGISIVPGAVTSFEAPDGSSASAASSAFAIRVSPLNAIGQADQLSIALDLLPTRSSVSAAPAPTNVIAPPAPAAPSMPRTGGGAFAMVFGTLAMGGAAFMRRRF